MTTQAQILGWAFPEPDPEYYRCRRCAEIFVAEDAVSHSRLEPEEFWGASVMRDTGVSHCPFCGSDDLQDACGDDYEPELDDAEDIP